MKKIILRIDGMTCSACSSGLEKYLAKQKGIISVNVNLILSLATIEYENLNQKDIEKLIARAGFKSTGELKRIEDRENNKEEKIQIILFGILALFLMVISMVPMLLKQLPLINEQNPILLSSIQLIISIIFLWYGRDILKNGFINLFHKIPNMDTLVTFSTLCSFFYSLYNYINLLKGNIHAFHNLYFESVCMVIYFIKLGKWIEKGKISSSQKAIQKLVQITPQTARIKNGKMETIVSLDEVKKGNIIVCKPGEKIAVDGIVKKGKTYVDESFITGESNPVLKEKDSKVIAGSLNYDGYIEYSAEKIGKESTISEIVTIIMEATNQKQKMQKLADKISSIFVPCILILAVLTFLIQIIIGYTLHTALIHMVTILIVACPCALGLAVPLVVVVSNGLCAERGIFIKNSEVLEQGKSIKTIVFDKTGTLTHGKLKVFKTYNYSSYQEEELLNIVANLESHSSHPIHTAFKISKPLEVEDFKIRNGIGIEGTIHHKKYQLGNQHLLNHQDNIYESHQNHLTKNGCSIIYVLESDQIIALIGVRDILRENIETTIQKLNDNHLEVIMLTGDNKKTAKIIAEEIGIKKVLAEVLPVNKKEQIELLQKENKNVMMVGDGINDAPALTSATIGVSINSSTDIAQDAADVILMNHDFQNLLDLIEISKNAYQVMKQNIFWAFLYNIIMIPIAMGLGKSIGLTLTPMLGSIAMTLSSLSVVLNALRLRRKINGNKITN